MTEKPTPVIIQENHLTGYVKLYRSLKNKSWYKKSEYVHLWIHLFIQATRLDREDWFNGKTIKLKPGQLITGRIKLSRETGIEQSKVERILKCFESEQQIKQQTCNKSRLISILNWQSYQASEQQPAQQVNNRRTTTEQQVNTIQEGREYKEYREGGEGSPFQFKLMADQMFIEQTCMAWTLTKGDIEKMILEFVAEQASKSKTHSDYNDFKKHFFSWGKYDGRYNDFRKVSDYEKKMSQIRQ